jgi:hypothetical protein
MMTTLLACGLAQVLVFAGVSQADDDASGAQLLPKNTLVFASMPDVKEYKANFDKSVTAAMYRDKELQPFIEDVRKKLTETTEKELGVTLDELIAIPDGEVTLALMERPAKRLAPVLIVDYGDNSETIDKLLKKLHEALSESTEHSTQDLQDVTVQVYTLKEEDGPFKRLVYFNEDKCLVFSTEIEALKEVLDRWEGDNSDTLANNEIFKQVMDRCKYESEDPTSIWFVNPIGLVQAGLSMATEVNPQAGMVGIFLPTLGLDKLRGWGGATYSSAGDYDTITKSYVFAEKPAGVLNIFQFPTTDLAPPKWVPADSSLYFSGNWSLPQAYQAIETLIDGIQGRGTTARTLDKIANDEDGPGIHVKKDVLDLLDGKFHMVQASEEDETVPHFLLAFDVKDVPRLKQTLAKAAKSVPQLETRDFNGETIYEMDSGEDQAVSFAVAAGHFVFTNDTPALEAMLRATATAPLSESTAYRMIAKHFPAKTSMLSFSKSDAQMKAVYDLLKNSQQVELFDGIDFDKLPPFEVLQKYMRPSGSYMVSDSKGALYVGFQLSEGEK